MTSSSQLGEHSKDCKVRTLQTRLSMKTFSSVLVISLMLCASVFAQTPPTTPPAAAAAAGTAGTKVAVIDFNRAVIECADGKKAKELIEGEMKKRQSDFEKAQGELEGFQKQLQTQGTAMSDAAKAELSKKIDTKNTE